MKKETLERLKRLLAWQALGKGMCYQARRAAEHCLR